MSELVLEVEDLHVELAGDRGPVHAVDGVSFQIRRGEIVGLVGESGSGKTLTSLALLGLLPGGRRGPRAARLAGSLRLGGSELLRLTETGWRALRGPRMAMIFQDPMMALNPYLRLETQLTEGPELHLGFSHARAKAHAVELLRAVGLPDPERRLSAYPHELSGGMRQRVMIAMALACEPDLLIADEPTTALDVTIQAQILELLATLCEERGTAVLFITHDLAVVSGLCDRVLVMYAGQIVEEARADALFADPQHPYTRALIACTPRVSSRAERLETIAGLPPRLDEGPFPGCRFAPRCPLVRPQCTQSPPAFVSSDSRGRRCVVPVSELS